MSHFFIFNLGILCIYLLGHFVEYCSPAEDCEWSSWTEPDSDQFQHRARDCEGKVEFESKNRTTENPPESTPIEHVDLLNHPGGSSSVKDTATLPTSKHHGNLSQSSTYPREETVGSTNYNSSISATTQINWHGKLDDDRSKTKLENSTDFREESVVSSQYSNSTTAKSTITSESESDKKNQSKLETATVTEDVIVMGNVSSKSDFGYAACEQRKEQELNGFRYVKECLISVLALILVIAVTALWCERQKRLKCEKERLYIFSLPQNTELTSAEENDARYNTMTDFTRLFSGSSAERLSSCVYQDITDMVSSEFSSPRSTYQQIPFRHSKQSNSEEAKIQDLATFI